MITSRLGVVSKRPVACKPARLGRVWRRALRVGGCLKRTIPGALRGRVSRVLVPDGKGGGRYLAASVP